MTTNSTCSNRPIPSICANLEQLRAKLEEVFATFDDLYRLVYQLKKQQDDRQQALRESVHQQKN